MGGSCRIAVTGKGGTGKTSIAALLAASLVASGIRPILAVDADPNANLHEALGVTVGVAISSTGTLSAITTVTVPAGQSSITFDLKTIDDALAEGSETITISVGDTEPQPIWELRERGIAAVGTIAEYYGFLHCFDITEIIDLNNG